MYLYVHIVWGQAPQMFNYQAIARDGTGNLLANTNISLRISILTGSISGTSQYTEIQKITTDPYGVFALNIGNGSPISGRFVDITWGNGNKYLKIEMDANNGNNFILMGTTQLLSVPYALYAEKSGNGTFQDDWENNGSSIYYNKGNVGIGVSSPERQFHMRGDVVNENNGGFLRIDRNTTGPTLGLILYEEGTQNWVNSNILNGFGVATIPDDDTGDFIIAEYGKFPGGSENQKYRFRVNGITGNVSIGTHEIEDAKARLQVSDGDIYIKDISKGVILTSPNGNCFRITINNQGNLVTTQISCP
jgi:hypothetical protein